MPFDPFSILSLIGAGAQGIAELSKQPVATTFITPEEYAKAKAEYDQLDKQRRLAPPGMRQALDRRMLELYPSIQQWEQKVEQETFRKEGVAETQRRLTERGILGAETITRGYGESLRGRGLKGAGAIYDPQTRALEDLARQVRYEKADVERQEAGTTLLERQAQAAQKTQQQYGQWGTESELWGAGAKLGLGIGSEFRQGGIFGGPTTAEQAMMNMNQLYKQQLQPRTMQESKEWGLGPRIISGVTQPQQRIQFNPLSQFLPLL